MKISSSAFENGKAIPDRYTRYGEDRSPPLHFEDVPREARSLALIVDDPDAPGGLFTHWVAYDIDANADSFGDNEVPKEVRYGLNSWNEAGYGGPKPGSGEHRYLFHLYALDQRLRLDPRATRQQVENAMQGHVVAQAELMGRYARPV